MKNERTTDNHESYGMVGFSRITSNRSQPLFGSSIGHRNTIQLTIKSASVDRKLHHNWFHGEKELIKIEMSSNQFAELITSLNMGDGIPCTLRRVNGQIMEPPPYKDQRKKFEDEFENDVKEVGKKLSSLYEKFQTLLNEKAPKRAYREFADILRMLAQDVNSNIPFVQSSFNEAIDKTVIEAKCEVESFVLNKIHNLGLEGLKDEMFKISEGTKIQLGKEKLNKE